VGARGDDGVAKVTGQVSAQGAARQRKEYSEQSRLFRGIASNGAARTRDVALATGNILSSRIARLSGAARAADEQMARIDSSVREAIAKGIEEPQIRVDSAGVVILASSPLVDT